MTETYVVDASGVPTIAKDPSAKLDYTFDWTEWLDAITDSLSTHVVTVDTGITLETSSIVGKKVVIWVSGGTVGKTYKVGCKITTANVPARIDERTILIKVKNR